MQRGFHAYLVIHVRSGWDGSAYRYFFNLHLDLLHMFQVSPTIFLLESLHPHANHRHSIGHVFATLSSIQLAIPYNHLAEKQELNLFSSYSWSSILLAVLDIVSYFIGSRISWC